MDSDVNCSVKLYIFLCHTVLICGDNMDWECQCLPVCDMKHTSLTQGYHTRQPSCLANVEMTKEEILQCGLTGSDSALNSTG